MYTLRTTYTRNCKYMISLAFQILQSQLHLQPQPLHFNKTEVYGEHLIWWKTEKFKRKMYSGNICDQNQNQIMYTPHGWIHRWRRQAKEIQIRYEQFDDNLEIVQECLKGSFYHKLNSSLLTPHSHSFRKFLFVYSMLCSMPLGEGGPKSTL